MKLYNSIVEFLKLWRYNSKYPYSNKKGVRYGIDEYGCLKVDSNTLHNVIKESNYNIKRLKL